MVCFCKYLIQYTCDGICHTAVCNYSECGRGYRRADAYNRILIAVRFIYKIRQPLLCYLLTVVSLILDDNDRMLLFIDSPIDDGRVKKCIERQRFYIVYADE